MKSGGNTGIDRFITRLAGWAVAVFQRVEREGAPVPDGPVLVVANHPNSLLDPLIVFRVAGRPTRPLAKAPLFEQALVGSVLRALGGLPVYRRQDDAALMHRNDDTFAAAIAALRRGDAIQIYPEGRSHSEPALVPLRTGAARIALGAEAESAWSLGLRVVPIGITYRRKSLFRGDVLAWIGASFTIADLRAVHDADPAQAVRQLTDTIAQKLEEVTLNLSSHDDLELIETADRLYTRQKGVQQWREREALAERVPRLRFFARGLAWLRANEPDRHRSLEHAVRRYQRALALYGATEADVPPQYGAGTVIRYLLRETLLLGIGAPLALAGALLWAPAYWAPRVTVRLVKPEFEAIATYKLATGFFAAPVTIMAAAVIGWWIGGTRIALVAGIATPVLGLIAIAWFERWRRVREDVRVFLRASSHRRGIDRVATLRATLTAEFDDVLQRIPEQEPSPST